MKPSAKSIKESAEAKVKGGNDWPCCGELACGQDPTRSLLTAATLIDVLTAGAGLAPGSTCPPMDPP